MVCLQPCFHIRSLVFRQPRGVLGKAGDQKEEDDGHDAGDDALEDENPTPRQVAAHTVHFTNGRGEKAAKGAGQGGAAEEKGVALLRLGTLIPHANEIEACMVSETSGQA